jgi:hypothetical protein
MILRDDFDANDQRTLLVTMGIVALCFMAFFWFLREPSSGDEKQADIVSMYQLGKLVTCAGSPIPKAIHDFSVILDAKDTEFIKDYLSVRGVETPSIDVILFVYEPANVAEGVDAHFNYLTITGQNSPTLIALCVDGGLRGDFPFNEQMYEKYKK